MTNSISLSFLAGILVGQCALEGRPGLVEVGAFVIAIVSAAVDESLPRAIYAGLPSALIVYAAVKTRSAKCPTWLASLGDASYAIYLLHVFLIAVVGKLSQAMLPSINADLLALIMTFAAVLVGSVCHRQVEVPLLRLLSSRPARIGLQADASARH